MKFKKTVSLVLIYSLMVNPLTTSAHIENNKTMSNNQNENSKTQQIPSDAEKKALKSAIKQLEKEIRKLKEEKTDYELNNQIYQISKKQKNGNSWFNKIIKGLFGVTIFSIGLAVHFKKPSIWNFEFYKDNCPEFLVPFRNYGEKIIDWFDSLFLGMKFASTEKNFRNMFESLFT